MWPRKGRFEAIPYIGNKLFPIIWPKKELKKKILFLEKKIIFEKKILFLEKIYFKKYFFNNLMM